MDVSKAIRGDHKDLQINDPKSHPETKSCEQTDLEDSKEKNIIFREGPVLYLGEECVLQVTSVGLKLTSPPQSKAKGIASKLEDLEISWQHVITAEMNASLEQENVRQSFHLHYIEMCDRTLRARCINLALVNEPADVWIDLIKDNCRTVPGRPKQMLVVVNTIGGMGNGAEIYQKKVAPIFQHAEIITNVVYTERPQHARDIAENEDLSSLDCVVAVGGDGTFQEVLSGMTIGMQKSVGVDYNDGNAKFVCHSKPIGFIPTGSWNCVSAALNRGVVEVETAALRIITGEIHKSQMFTFHSNGKLVTVSGLSFVYGALNKLTKRAAQLRWMKRYRYYYTMFSYLFKKKERMRLQLEYLVDASQENSPTHDSPGDIKEESSAGLQWIRHDSQGRPYGNVLCTTPNLTDKEDCTMKNPFTDRASIYIDMGCPTLRILKLVVAVITGKKITEQYENVDVMDNVRGVKFKALRPEKQGNARASQRSSEYLLSVDGECLDLEVPEVEIRIIPSFIPIYAAKSS